MLRELKSFMVAFLRNPMEDMILSIALRRPKSLLMKVWLIKISCYWVPRIFTNLDTCQITQTRAAFSVSSYQPTSLKFDNCVFSVCVVWVNVPKKTVPSLDVSTYHLREKESAGYLRYFFT